MESKEHCRYGDSNGLSRIKNDLISVERSSSRRKMQHPETARRDIRVGIVGAGFAGLRCADVLIQHGCRVTIFEARNRVGGRVAQSNHLGHPVDLGPNWIHGTEDNPIMRIAKSTGTQLHAWEEGQAVHDTNGESLDCKEAYEYAQLLWDDGVIADAFRYSNEHHDSIDPRRSLYDFFEERADRMFMDEPADVAKRKRMTFLQVASIWGTYVGSPLKMQSLKFFWLEECIEGENPFVAETYHKILDDVAKAAKAKAEVRLRCEVTFIHSNDGQESSAGEHHPPSIQTADGRIEEFDEVVVTCPLGWLKRNKHAFKPTLPIRLSQAIDHVGYGTLDKVYITFPSAFWDSPLASGRSLSNGIDPEHKTPDVTVPTVPLHQLTAVKFHNAVAAKATDVQVQTMPPAISALKTTHAPIAAPTYVNAATPMGGDDESALPVPQTEGPAICHSAVTHYPGSTQWLIPSYAPDTNPLQWDQQAMNLAALSPSCAHPTLLFYVYGDCSKHIANLVASCKVLAERDAKLLDFFRPYYSRLPNYSTSNPNCTPKAVLATAWAADEFAGYGSYSNFQIGLQNGNQDIEVMRHGMPERGVWLAGEHTAPFIALGTSTGAYWSGEKVAEKIIGRYGLSKHLSDSC